MNTNDLSESRTIKTLKVIPTDTVLLTPSWILYSGSAGLNRSIYSSENDSENNFGNQWEHTGGREEILVRSNCVKMFIAHEFSLYGQIS